MNEDLARDFFVNEFYQLINTAQTYNSANAGDPFQGFIVL